MYTLSVGVSVLDIIHQRQEWWETTPRYTLHKSIGHKVFYWMCMYAYFCGLLSACVPDFVVGVSFTPDKAGRE